jgi:small-conductance mechanosensitive channel
MLHKVLGNTVLSYVLSLLLLVAGCVFIRILGSVLLRRLTKPNAEANSTTAEVLVKSIRRYLLPMAYTAVFYMATRSLVLSPGVEEIMNTAVLALIMILGAIFVSSMAVLLFNRYWESKHQDASRELAVKAVSGLLKIIVWATALVVFLDNVGIKINTLIAGIGIGGIAIAFAAQAILGDIFCFFTIFFDRPFEIGDFIVAGTQSGTVEHIGLKTTRLRALSGEQIIFSNTDLTGARIQNYKRMEERRVLFTLGVTYDTPVERLRQIPLLLKGIVDAIPETRFSRSHFLSYGEYSLNFETAYFILSNDYDKYLDIHQQVNLAIKEAFEQQGISFAFPITKVQLARKRCDT